jgi:hypothetical protein
VLNLHHSYLCIVLIRYEEAWNPLGIDWVHAHVNGTLHHFAEGRHTTDAITENAIGMIKNHIKDQQLLREEVGHDGYTYSPLFLYVAYTAAHSPLQPLPRHEAK